MAKKTVAVANPRGRRIVICGCGPGAPEYVTPATRQASERAEVLVGAKRLLDLVPESKAERIVVGGDIEQVLEVVAARRDKRVVVLVSGDACLCSLAHPLLERFGRRACDVVPGISSVQAAFARLGLDWLGAHIISAHHRRPDCEANSLEGFDKIAVLMGRKDALAWLARLAGQLGRERRIFVCENLTLKNERVREVSLAGLARLRPSPLTVVLLIKKGFLA